MDQNRGPQILPDDDEAIRREADFGFIRILRGQNEEPYNDRKAGNDFVMKFQRLK